VSSVFQWLDYSEHERRKSLEVIALFQEQDTRDELGVGAVRDAFADLFFPGTSTIQTRARYFLFVPWIYLELERREIPSAEIAKRARIAEIRLIDALARADDANGTIGIEARDSLKRLPSNIYWQGLAEWGIRIFPGSQDQYHRAADSFSAARNRTVKNDDNELVGDGARVNWHAGIPTRPVDFPDDASFRLTRREAEYLRERVFTRHPTTLLAFLLDRGRPGEGADFPWQHAQLAEFLSRHQEQLDHARNFSEVIHGAALLYNLMLSEAANREAWTADYAARLVEWSQRRDQRHVALAQWDRVRFWDIVSSVHGSVAFGTRRFVDRWIDLTLSLPDVGASPRTRALVAERELALKGVQARLANPRALERWNGAAGAAQLNFRWGVSSQIIADIHAGLASSNA